MTRPIFVLNLDRSPKRLAEFDAEIGAHNRSYSRISAVDGQKLNEDQAMLVDHKACRRYMGRGITPSEVGCYLSHAAAAKAVVDSGADAAFVFEDDVLLPEGFFSVADTCIDWLVAHRPGWDILTLGYSPTHFTQPVFEVSGASKPYTLNRSFYFPMGGFAQCWSAKGARLFLEGAFPIASPVDNYIRRWVTTVGEGYGLDPHLGWVRTDSTDIGSVDERRHFQRTWDYGYRKQKRMLGLKLRAFRRFKKERAPDKTAPE